MAINLPPPPGQTSLVDRLSNSIYTITAVWYQWLITLMTRVQSCAFVQKKVELTNQNTSLSTTAIPRDDASAGYYRISTYLRVTTAATTGAATSAIQLTIGWTEGTIVLSKAGTNLTTNTTSTFEQSTLFIKVDQNTAINYSTTYASDTALQMKYELSIICELVA